LNDFDINILFGFARSLGFCAFSVLNKFDPRSPSAFLVIRDAEFFRVLLKGCLGECKLKNGWLCRPTVREKIESNFSEEGCGSGEFGEIVGGRDGDGKCCGV
jgi:hypothetical protein